MLNLFSFLSNFHEKMAKNTNPWGWRLRMRNARFVTDQSIKLSSSF